MADVTERLRESARSREKWYNKQRRSGMETPHVRLLYDAAQEIERLKKALADAKSKIADLEASAELRDGEERES